MKKPIIIAIIPARKGSKAIKNKNIISLKNKPLLAHSIILAKKCGFNKVIVSTDSKKYKKIAKKYGAEVPFLRPRQFCRDRSLDEDYLKHCYDWFLKKKYKIDIFVNLRPTTPFRDHKVVIKAIKIFLRKKISFLRSAHLASETPFKWFKRNKNGFFKSMIKSHNLHTTNLTRQQFDPVYIPNGYVDILKTNSFKKKNIFGKKMYVFVTKRVLEIDTLEDLKFIKKI